MEEDSGRTIEMGLEENKLKFIFEIGTRYLNEFIGQFARGTFKEIV